MPHVKGFKGYRFSAEAVGDFNNVVTPPFDVISETQREALANLSPHNTVHLILPKKRGELDGYQAANEDFQHWISAGVLEQDAEESLYLLEQSFNDKDGNAHTRRAFFAAVKIPENDENYVLGHERTFPHKITDRLALTTALRANMGAIFVMYFDQEHRLGNLFDPTKTEAPKVVAETIDGAKLKLWQVPADPTVESFFDRETLYIADGHHRFATAKAYRDEMRAKNPSGDLQPYDFVLMGLVAFDDPGLLVYPAHRVLDRPADFDRGDFFQSLEPWFTIEAVDGGLEEKVHAASGCVLGLHLKGDGDWLLTLKDIDREAFLGSDHGESWRALDVSILHRGVLENILKLPAETEFIYEPDASEALAFCDRGEKSMVFLMNGATPEQIKACADAGEFMPQKATYLFPKLPTGGVFHRLE